MSEITDKAQQLLNGRLESIRVLEEQSARVREVRDLLAAAERAEGEAWSAAAGAGWTPAELKRLGFSQPPSRRGGRRPVSRRTDLSAAPTTHQEER
ncbi:hypothetical protein [Calidifontibacter indicus]|uniref:hypothetical protein n=1 Tax=Calidifontibacter indicus TaxID=419650 RepID=UPI0011C071F7|nr:hypothetical protein [Calidifontibacter indicus]